MFPLGTVLIPGGYLPLQVFEPRYRALVQDCLAGAPEFGVALIERGSEVGGGDRRFDVGCVARIVQVGELPGDRLAVAAVGTRRIRVERWLPDDPYPRAEVAEWPDPEPEAEIVDRLELVFSELRRVLGLAAELGESVPSVADVKLMDDPVDASYQLVSLAPVGPLDQMGLLGAPTVSDRLDQLAEHLDDIGTVLATRLAGG